MTVDPVIETTETERLPGELESRLVRLAETLVDQRAARPIVRPQKDAAGYWFGGGNLVAAPDGGLLLCGRFRNEGDSRTGVGVGQRGLELAIFRSEDGGATFEPAVRWGKHDLTVDSRTVLSIEGAALRFDDGGVELFVSSEKTGIDFPEGFEPHRKPGTGVWTIESLWADSLESLRDTLPRTVLSSDDPRFMHVKDPLLYDAPDGTLVVMFCTHPFCWTSSNAAAAIRLPGEDSFRPPRFDWFPRGVTWDVAISRVTSVVDLPAAAAFDGRRVSLIFYDGGECVRSLDEHASAVSRPRGYSCEELGGLAYCLDGRWDRPHRLSLDRPSFVSPWGTGCSRYVDVLATDRGWFATWQQSQTDRSQPLVMNAIDPDRVASILEGR